MEDVEFKIGGIGPFKGLLARGADGKPSLLKFEQVEAGLEHFSQLSEVTIMQSGHPDLHVAGTGRANLQISDATKTLSGEILLRDR